jgi:DNA-directed RNA polymerase subunit omega
MARITVEDCLEHVPNRFSLVLVTAERCKQLMKGAKTLIEDDRTNKEIVTALREIAAGSITPDMSGFDEQEQVGKQLSRGGEALPPAVDDLLPPAADELPPEA